MAFIRVNNNDNVMLLDSEVFNLTLSKKGSLYFSYNGESYKYVEYTAKSELPPLIAFSCKTKYASLISTKKIGNTYSFLIAIIGGWRVGETVDVDYYIFDAGEPTKEGTGNLILRNKDGYVTFDSDKKYLAVYSLNDYPFFNYQDWRTPFPEEIVTPTEIGKKYAAIVNKVSYLYIWSGGGGETDEYIYYDGLKISNGAISRSLEMFDSRNYQTGGSGNFVSNSTNSQYMIVDVTGF
ncbi:hypothetical protein ACIPUO_16495 [Pectobacterium carotovorum]|uniref:hypothetical protein n=1 Tax=Pectobacterium carotovorum TaxID=554 RepID=UPI0038028897